MTSPYPLLPKTSWSSAN